MPIRSLDCANVDLFLAHARPGLIGLVGAHGQVLLDAVRLATARRFGVGAGLWSHAFLVLDRRVRAGREQILILETTRVPVAHRVSAGARGHPAWEGPQWSILVSRPSGADCGEIRGQCSRRAPRRYRLETWAPNVALIDPGLSPRDTVVLQRRMRAALRPDERQLWLNRVRPLDRVLRAAGVPDDEIAATDLLGSDFIVRLLSGLVPELGEGGQGGVLAAGWIYEALRQRRFVFQSVRSPSLQPSPEAVALAPVVASLGQSPLIERVGGRTVAPTPPRGHQPTTMSRISEGI